MAPLRNNYRKRKHTIVCGRGTLRKRNLQESNRNSDLGWLLFNILHLGREGRRIQSLQLLPFPGASQRILPGRPCRPPRPCFGIERDKQDRILDGGSHPERRNGRRPNPDLQRRGNRELTPDRAHLHNPNLRDMGRQELNPYHNLRGRL